jgi:hypothetical protein
MEAVKNAAMAAGAFDAVVCSHHAHGGKGAVSSLLLYSLLIQTLYTSHVFIGKYYLWIYCTFHILSSSADGSMNSVSVVAVL